MNLGSEVATREVMRCGPTDGQRTSSRSPPPGRHRATTKTGMASTLDGPWQAFCNRLATAGDVLAAGPDEPGVQAAGLRYLLHLLNSGLDLFVMDVDPAHPEVCRPQDPDKRWGLDCPNAHYGRAPIDGAGTYRVIGGPGDAHYLGITVTAGHLGTIGVRSIGALSRPGSLLCDPDGSFELTLSPHAHDGNWI